MSGRVQNRRRRRVPQAPHADERWLLTYSDMITLLMALFIVMWAVSAVNQSKFSELSMSLHSAFGGKVMKQQKSVLNGRTGVLTGGKTASQDASESAAATEAKAMQRLQSQIVSYAAAKGLRSRLSAVIEERGLVVRLATDDLLFDTGQAVLKPAAEPVLAKVAQLVERTAPDNDIRVEGNTDDVPISTPLFHSNWELSAARAAAVLESLHTHRVPEARLSLAGYADQKPVAPNQTAAGRSLNRRVDLVVVRKYATGSGS